MRAISLVLLHVDAMPLGTIMPCLPPRRPPMTSLPLANNIRGGTQTIRINTGTGAVDGNHGRLSRKGGLR